MASKSAKPSSLALFLLLNLIFFSYVSAWKNPPTPIKPNPRGRCPIDALKLGVCANVLSGLLNITIGTPPVQPCCSVIQGLLDLEAAVCLCTAIRANILGINLDIPLSLSLLLNVCSRRVPSGFICP